MTVTCTFTLEYDTPEEAKEIAAALQPDSQGYLNIEVNGSTVTAIAQAKTVPSMLHTINDFLSCLSVAEKIGKGLK
jgi:tRNA threonylcarbamoyladenosine modification (KEOPS) complex  Pcc1 subunit